jgi:hypothetical protein
VKHACAVLAAVVCASPAAAFESQCRPDPDGSRPRTPEAYAQSICAVAETCGEGLSFARGAQLGEHAFLFRLAMRWAGLPPSLLDDREVLRYYTDGVAVADSSVPSVAPAGPGKMLKGMNTPGLPPDQSSKRILTIPEFAQVPDGSYSLSDFLMGNEHCPVTPGRGATAAQLNDCHTFASHMGVVNSSHFPPQARAFYEVYHTIALRTAKRCAAMQKALEAHRTHMAADTLDRMVLACEKEALVFEAVGAHYLADAWSSGHMWQRWGSPLFPGPDGYVNAHLASTVSGLIHGWRSVVRNQSVIAYVLFDIKANQHDQLAMPGFFEDYSPDEELLHLEDAVHWTYPDAVRPRGEPTHHGGGDLYLLWCSGRTQDPRWAVAPFHDGGPIDLGDEGNERPLSPQYRRMMTCLFRGIEEVYNRGPHRATNGELVSPAVGRALDAAIPPPSAGFDPDAAPQPDASGVRSPLCWEQRATNRSMVLGAGVSRSGSFASPQYLTRVAIEVLPATAEAHGDPDALSVLATALGELFHHGGSRMRYQLGQMGSLMRMAAARSPDGTDVANLERSDGYNGLLSSFFGIARNSGFVDLVRNGGVPYLERPDPKTWNNQPGISMADIIDCRSDDVCMAANPRQYCDRTTVVSDQFMPACIDLETPILRAFRDAEGPHWCSGDNWRDLNAAREACRGKPANSAQCQSCVQVLLPRLRNGCDPGPEGFEPMTGTVDNRSLCDLFFEDGVRLLPRVNDRPTVPPMVHVPFDPKDGEDWASAARRVALEACQSGPEPFPVAWAYGTSATPPATATVIAPFPFAGYIGERALCGRGVATLWWRYDLTHACCNHFQIRVGRVGGSGGSVFDYVDRVENLELLLLRGPRCDPVLDLIATATQEADTLHLRAPAADVCFRLKAKNRNVRTGIHYSLDWY